MSLNFDGIPNSVVCQRIPGGMIFHWSRPKVGYGMLTMRVTRNKLEVDTECMGSEFCADVVRQAIEEALAGGPSALSGAARPVKP